MAEVIGSAEILIISNPQPVEQSVNRVRRAAQSAGTEIRRALTFTPRSIEVQIDVDTDAAQAQVEQFTRDAAGRLRDARGRFTAASREIGDGIGSGVGDGSFRASRSVRDLVDSVGGAVGRLGDLGGKAAPGAQAALLAFAGSAGAATVATAGLATGVAGLGVIALAQSEEVKQSFSQLGDTIKSVGLASAEPLRGPLLSALREIGAAAEDLGPDLTRLFAASAPAVEELTDGILGLVRGALPGITTAVGRAGPVLDALSEGLANLGVALGETFDALSQDPEATAQALDGLLDVVVAILPAVGQLAGVTVQVAGPAFQALARIVEATTFLIDQFTGAVSVVASLLTGNFDAAVNQVATSGAALTGVTLGEAQATTTFSQSLQGALEAVQANKAATAEATVVAGVYATQVEAVNAQLAQQKADADSLRQGIFALTEVTRSATDAQSAYEAQVDFAAEVIRDQGRVLEYTNGKLNLNSEAARDVYDELSDLAAATKDYSAKTLEATGSTEAAAKVFKDGEKKLLALARSAGLSADEAKRLAREILGIPPVKTTKIKVEYETVGAGPAAGKPLLSAQGRIVRSPIVSVVGEAGPEVILPLTRPQRALQLAQQSGLFDVLNRAVSTAGHIIGGPAQGPLGPLPQPARPVTGPAAGGPGRPSPNQPVGGPIALPPGGGLDPFRREGPVPVFNVYIGGQKIDEIVEAKVSAAGARNAQTLRQGTRR